MKQKSYIYILYFFSFECHSNFGCIHHKWMITDGNQPQITVQVHFLLISPSFISLSVFSLFLSFWYNTLFRVATDNSCANCYVSVTFFFFLVYEKHLIYTSSHIFNKYNYRLIRPVWYTAKSWAQTDHKPINAQHHFYSSL